MDSNATDFVELPEGSCSKEVQEEGRENRFAATKETATTTTTTTTTDEEGRESHTSVRKERKKSHDLFQDMHRVIDGQADPNPVTVVRFAMTLLFFLLLPAALLSLLIVPKYFLVIIVFWVLLWLCFVALIVTMQKATRNSVVMHPLVHHYAKAVATEYSNFLQDWTHMRQRQLLLLEDERQSTTEASRTNENSPQLTGHHTHNKIRPKSVLFRTMTRVAAPLIRRRRKKKEAREQHQALSYTAPPLETEMV